MRNKEIATTILFLRHGATDFPEDRYYCDAVEDPPLNPAGLKQAATWAETLKTKSIAAVYVSPSRRTQETARLATSGLGLSGQTLDGLRERSFGVWDGLTTDEIKNKYPAEWSGWKNDLLHFTPSGGESLVGFSKRVDQTVQGLLSRHAGQTLLVVTHVGPIRMIVAAALGIPLENVKRLVVGSCSNTQIEYTESWPNLVSFSLRPELFYKEGP
jgi:ribonuclease H / adenosylcobalamin/alpha-ribazole phosphatase